ncbi:hypothetical protein [Streptomyces olivaceus]|uniref:hypothetical protein n=1 Tax=Streptomyces olivaceus TaxID=47716 RepID=UPI0036373A59
MSAGLRSRREYCTCVVVQNYDTVRAAAKLGCKPRWLEDNLRRLPHQKFGHNAPVFCDCELRIIQALCTVPAAGEDTTPDRAETQATPSLRSIRPSGSRRQKQPAG